MATSLFFLLTISLALSLAFAAAFSLAFSVSRAPVVRTALLTCIAFSLLAMAPRASWAATHVAQRTAIVNVYAGQSSVRIANTGTSPARHEIEVYGVSDRAPIGRFVLEVPAKASLVFRPETMIQTLTTVNWDQLLVLYVTTAADGQLWQHVRQYPNGETVNASVCAPARSGGSVTAAGPLVALNLNSEGAAPLASFVTLHNPTDAALELDARLTSAKTGRLIGTVPVTLAPHETLNRSGHFFQTTAGWFFPDEAQFNLEFVPRVAGFGADLLIDHTMVDLVNGERTSLANPCPVKGGVTAQVAG